MSLLSHLVLASSGREMSQSSRGRRSLPGAPSGCQLEARRGLAFLFTLATAVAPVAPSVAGAQSCPISTGAMVSPAVWSAPLDRLISLHVRDISLRDALDRVSTESRVRLSYTTETVPLDTRV